MSNQTTGSSDSAVLLSADVTGNRADNTTSMTLTFDVRLSPADPTPYKMVTYLTVPGGLKSTTLLMLVSGATYDHN